MDAATSGSGGGGPAPFLLKTYEMVDDSATDEIVSWSPSNNSFVVWNPPEFARLLLPTYFKHNNFSSFIRQLNTYGFRKIDPERWEFFNEEFIRDQKHLLKNIHRRKPIHSHSQPQQQGTTTCAVVVDEERTAFEEEISRLSHEKAAMESKLKQEQSAGKLQIEELIHRMICMDRRQEVLLVYLEKSVQNSSFIERLAKKIESMDLSEYSKKRRRPPQVENGDSIENSIGNSMFPDFTDKLRLEFSSVVSDINLVSHSTQSSNEEEGEGEGEEEEEEEEEEGLRSPQIMTLRSNEAEVAAPELSDTGTSFTFMKMDSVVGEQNYQQRFQGLGEEEGETETAISCHLNLTLASSQTLQVDKTQQSERRNNENPTSDSAMNGQFSAVAPAPQGRVNDVFWEQFLTEKPGVLENEEEASSNYSGNRDNDQDGRRFGYGVSRNTKSMERLTL